MKYKVSKKGRPGIYIISKDEVKKLVKDKCKDDIIHCMINSGFFIGADWSVNEFNKFIDTGNGDFEVDMIAITIPPQMGHSIAIPMGKLYLFDVGEIKEEELEILE